MSNLQDSQEEVQQGSPFLQLLCRVSPQATLGKQRLGSSVGKILTVTTYPLLGDLTMPSIALMAHCLHQYAVEYRPREEFRI
jgi:hypothetical protein